MRFKNRCRRLDTLPQRFFLWTLAACVARSANRATYNRINKTDSRRRCITTTTRCQTEKESGVKKSANGSCGEIHAFATLSVTPAAGSLRLFGEEGAPA